MSTSASHLEPLSIMGVKVSPFASHQHALEHVDRMMAADRKQFWVAINPQKIYRAWRDPSLSIVLNGADVGICDGIGVSVAEWVLTGRRLRRCTGCGLFFSLMPLAAERGWRLFLLGASPASNKLACEKLRARFPGLQIAGRRDGYFRDAGPVIGQINNSRADMVFVAMGSPRQEMWIAQHMAAINARFFMGVGGTFDVASGARRRAPRLVRKMGMEFLYQLATQPWRWRRQVVYLPFALKIIERKIWGADYAGVNPIPEDCRGALASRSPGADRRVA